MYHEIQKGADSFLFAEYRICAMFLFAFGIVVLILTANTPKGARWAGRGCRGAAVTLERRARVQAGTGPRARSR